MKCRTVRTRLVASRGYGTFFVILALAGSSALAQSRSGALGSGGIGLVGRSQGSLFTRPGYFAFDSYTVGADRFFNQPRAVSNGLMSVSLRRSGGPGAGLPGRTGLGGAPAFFVPGAADPRRPGARYIMPRAMNGPGTASNRFGLAAMTARTASPQVAPFAPNGRFVGAPPALFAESIVGTGVPNTLFYDAMTDPSPEATDDAFLLTGGVAPDRLRELENAARFSPGSKAAGPARDAEPATDPLDAFAARRRAKFASYLNQAWAHFRARDYQRAAAAFGLASQADATESEAVRGRFYSVLLIDRLSVAGALFDRLLRSDAKLFDRPGDLRQRFDDPAEYRAFVARLRTHAEHADAPETLVALYAYILWQQGETFNARAMARRAAGSNPRSRYAPIVTRMVSSSSDPSSPGARSRPRTN